jgi:hypothetical protein
MKRRAWGWAAVGLLGCAGKPATPDAGAGKGFYADNAPPTRVEWQALAQLAAEGAQLDEALFRNGQGGLLLLRGALGQVEPSRFVTAHPALFRQAQIAAQPQLTLEDGSFAVRATQLISGRRALGRGLVFRYDVGAQLTEIAGRLEAPAALPDPVLSPEAAKGLAQAIRQVPVVSVENVAWTDEDAAPRGAYRVVLDDEWAAATRIAVTLDDQTGDVLETEEELEFIQGSGRGVFGNKESFQIDHGDGGAYSMRDATRRLATYVWDDSLPARWSPATAGRAGMIQARRRALRSTRMQIRRGSLTTCATCSTRTRLTATAQRWPRRCISAPG